MDNAIETALRDITTTTDLLEKSLKLAGLVTRVFRDAGWDLVVVGGSAVEFYTEGAYMSGDIDFCRRNVAAIPLRQAQDLMATLKATGGPRSWQVAGVFVDLLGLLENEATTAIRTIETPCGPVNILPAELVLVERVLVAFTPEPNSEGRAVAAKMLAACVSGATPVDWNEVERLAALPTFKIERELQAFKQEILRELGC